MMFAAYNKIHPKVIWNLPGTGACDFKIRSVDRTRPGCCLHQGASLWNDAPAGAAPGQRSGTRVCKPQHWSFSLNHTR